MPFEVLHQAGIVDLSYESGVDEDSYGFELSVAWVSASFGLCWNDCFVDD